MALPEPGNSAFKRISPDSSQPTSTNSYSDPKFLRIREAFDQLHVGTRAPDRKAATAALAQAAMQLAAQFIVRETRWGLSEGPLRFFPPFERYTCTRCSHCDQRSTRYGLDIDHKSWCPVGEARKQAAEVRRALASPAFPQSFHPQHTERSQANGNRTQPGRADGGPSGASAPVLGAGLTLHGGDDFGEPMFWDPEHVAVVDRAGMVVVDLAENNDLTPRARLLMGARIATCLNWCRGLSYAWMEDAKRSYVLAMNNASGVPEAPEFDGDLDLHLDCDGLGWFVMEWGVRTNFPSGYLAAKAHFDKHKVARANMMRRSGDKTEVTQ